MARGGRTKGQDLETSNVDAETHMSFMLDGMRHEKGGDCCSEDRRCQKCGGRVHFQGIYGGYIVFCEDCYWGGI